MEAPPALVAPDDSLLKTTTSVHIQQSLCNGFNAMCLHRFVTLSHKIHGEN